MFAATALLSLSIPAVCAADPIGDVTKVELSAFGTPPADARRELFLGTAVVQDELVETVIGGGASITFTDGSQFHLGSGSQAALDQFVYNPSGSSVVELGVGVFRFIGPSLICSAHRMPSNQRNQPMHRITLHRSRESGFSAAC